MGYPDLSGGGVISEQKDKAVEERHPPPKKPPGYREFEKVLKQVIKAPPLRRPKNQVEEGQDAK
jgi:hypothetical protein